MIGSLRCKPMRKFYTLVMFFNDCNCYFLQIKYRYLIVEPIHFKPKLFSLS